MEESRSERTYRWTIRTLYVVGLGLNAVYLARQFAETPEGEIAMRQIRRHVEKATHPIKLWRDYQLSRPRVINSAEVTVRLAAEKEEGDGDE